MPVFVCTRCGALDNTAMTDYWWNKAHGEPVLCSQCETDAWHNSFPRRIATTADAKNVLNPEVIGHTLGEDLDAPREAGEKGE